MQVDENKNSDSSVNEVSEVGSDSIAELDEKPRFGRRRRRATSSGVVSGE